jgi:uncharacterized protein YbcV (DUF1398 family)
MDKHQQIKACYAAAANYPDLANRLQQIGLQSYTVDTATSTVLYRFAEGENVLHPGSNELRMINAAFDREKTIDAIRTNQQGKSDYPGFMQQIADAGVRFYEATLQGDNRRVTYIGTDGFYEEKIPSI